MARVPKSSAEVRRALVHDIREGESVGQHGCHLFFFGEKMLLLSLFWTKTFWDAKNFFGSGNRFAEVADRDGEAHIPGLHGRRVVLVPQDRDGTPQSIQDVRTEDDASPVGRPEEFNLESDEHGERHSEADTESLPGDGASAVSVDDMHVPLTEPDAKVRVPRVSVEIRAACEFSTQWI